MYKLFTPLWLLLWLSGQIGSQSYTFSVDSETYIDLDGGLALTGTSNWGRDVDLEIDIPLGFTFSLFGRPIDTLYYFYTDLYTSPERSDGIINCDALVASTSSLADRGSVNDGDSQSPITYHLTGDAPARIGIIEWENAGYRDDISDNDASAAYTNFQIWLYEKSGTIELHYGPNSPGELDGVDIIEPGVIMIKDYYYNPDSDSLSWTELFYLADDAASPKVEQVNTIEALDTLDLHLNSVPTSGTVYRFTATATTGIFQPSLPLASFDVFPNPTTDRFVVRLPEGTTDRDSRLGIFDTSGRQVKDLPFQDGNFDLNGLPGGVYQLRVLIPTGQAFTGRIVKQ